MPKAEPSMAFRSVNPVAGPGSSPVCLICDMCESRGGRLRVVVVVSVLTRTRMIVKLDLAPLNLQWEIPRQQLNPVRARPVCEHAEIMRNTCRSSLTRFSQSGSLSWRRSRRMSLRAQAGVSGLAGSISSLERHRVPLVLAQAEKP